MIKLLLPDQRTVQLAFSVLDLIPDTHVWLKDAEGVFLFGNSMFYERFGIRSLEGLQGKTDYDLAPQDMARQYTEDDDLVLAGGMVTNRLELIPGLEGSVDWFLTSKWPVYDNKDAIFGSLGLSRHLNSSERRTVPYQELSTPINYIHAHIAEPLSVANISEACNLSVSALERRFKKHLKKTPHQYIMELRLERGRSLLMKTEKGIGTIALETGFSDHSHFTRTFTKHFGEPPSAVRLRCSSSSQERHSRERIQRIQKAWQI